MNINEKNTILITCAPGLTDFLRFEVEGLGFKVHSSHKAGLETKASLLDCQRLNLTLRTAFNVLYLLKQFRCTGPDELYRKVYAINWEEIIPADEYLSVISRVDTPTINHTTFPAMKTKDAIVDRIAKYKGSRPNSGAKKNNVVINLYWKKDRCWVYLNTSGNKLADRGYRKMPHLAPMQETLAAGVILATDFDGTCPFVVPMCGSGTLAIEAAMIALNKAPCLLRSNYGFMHLEDFDKQQWQNLRKEALKKSRKNTAFPIIATDIDKEAIRAAVKNATTAGVEHLIDFKICDFADTPIPEGQGVIIVNPEYGFRLGQQKKLEETYERIGDFFKQNCAGYTAYIFTGNMSLAKKVGLKASRKFIFFNGEIECRLLKYQMYRGTQKNTTVSIPN